MMSLILFGQASAMNAVLTCLRQKNDRVEQYAIAKRQGQSAAKLNQKMQEIEYVVMRCVNDHINAISLTADCSGLPPPNIKSQNAIQFDERIIQCHQMLENGLVECMNAIKRLKVSQRTIVLRQCTNKLEEKVLNCAKKVITKGLLVTRPLERSLSSFSPLWTGPKDLKEMAPVWVCLKNKEQIPGWVKGTLVKKGPTFSIVLTSLKGQTQVANVQIAPMKNIQPYYLLKQRSKGYRQRALVDKALFKIHPLVKAIEENKATLPTVNGGNLFSYKRVDDKTIEMDFNQTTLKAKLTLRLRIFLEPVSAKPAFRCEVIGNTNVESLPWICNMNQKEGT